MPTAANLVAYVDRYQMDEVSKHNNCKVDSMRQAELISLLLGPLARKKTLYAIVNEHDKEGVEAYESAGYEMRPMNGNRPKELSRMLNRAMQQPFADHLVIVGSDEAYGGLCSVARHHDSMVSIWSPTIELPDDLKDASYEQRYLSELLPDSYIKLGSAALWLDIENHLISLKKAGFKLTINDYIASVTTAVNTLGNVTYMNAAGDFGQLERDFGNIQRDLVKLGVRTSYMVNMHGKNTADMQLASEIHTTLEHDPNIQTVIIGTGDRDFRPVVDAAKRRRKKVVLLALRDNLSEELKSVADNVIYLDDYLPAKPGIVTPVIDDKANHVDPNNPLLIPLLAYSHAVAQKRRTWLYKNQALGLSTPEQLQAMLTAGLIKNQGEGKLALNTTEPLMRNAHFFAPWVVNRVSYLVKERVERRQMKYVDSNFLFKGMSSDAKCKEMGIGQERTQSNAWLDAAAKAGILVKKQQPHYSETSKMVDTWWPVGYVEPTTTGTEAQIKPDEPIPPPPPSPEDLKEDQREESMNSTLGSGSEVRKEKEIVSTGGGLYINGNVTIKTGNFIGRDQVSS